MNNSRANTTMKFVSFLIVMPRVLSDRILNFIFHIIRVNMAKR